MTLQNLKALRDQLRKQLAQEELDFGEVLRLSTEIARADPNHVRFTTDAAIVSRLGRELVSKQETALAELVKNAYDADATRVTLTFGQALEDGGVLEIVDDGHGMSRDDIINGFMRLSTDEKVRHPVSPKFKRDRAGEKGIGRFAAERLGTRLILTTKAAHAAKALQVYIDWDAFQSGLDIGSVGNEIKEIESSFSEGTILRIEGLRDGWSDAQIRQVWSYVASLQTPLPVRPTSKKDTQRDPGFATEFLRDTGSLKGPSPVTDAREFFRYALAVVHLTIDERGRANWWIKSERYGDLDKRPTGLDRSDPLPLKHARSARLTAYYYIRSTALYPPGIFPALSEILKRDGGVRLYRNGYRVLPYGEPGNDWLGLDQIYRQRSTVLAPIGNPNWLGYVEVEDPKGDAFEETSSREGLIETEAYRELVALVSAAMLGAARHVDRARTKEKQEERKRQRERKPRQSGKSSAALVKQAAENLIVTARTAPSSPATNSAVANLREAINHFEKEYASHKESIRQLADEKAMLRVLASMGLTIAEFAHEYGSRAAAIKNDIEVITKELAGKAKGAAVRLQSHFNDVEGFSAYFAATIAQNQSRLRRPIELFAFSEEFVEQMRPLFGPRITDIEVVPPTEEQIYTTAMHPSEWSSILMNFMTNSRKAIERAGLLDGKIQILTGAGDNKTVYLTFCDNGVGIPDEIRDLVFDAFFSTTASPSAWASEQEHALGTGLGLKIVSDIAEGVRGKVEIVEAPRGLNTAIRVTVPAASEDELDKIYGNEVLTH